MDGVEQHRFRLSDSRFADLKFRVKSFQGFRRQLGCVGPGFEAQGVGFGPRDDLVMRL